VTALSRPFIPVIDVAPLQRWDGCGLAGVSAAVREAFTGSGFCYIENHGVPEDVIREGYHLGSDSRFYEGGPLAPADFEGTIVEFHRYVAGRADLWGASNAR
jgi:hypothetical protein